MSSTLRDDVDPVAAEEFAEELIGHYAGANAFFMGAIGDRLGLFASLDAHGPATSVELAAQTGFDERYLREWLGGMAAAGYLDYDPATERYSMPAHRAAVLADEDSPWFFGAAFFDFSTNFGATFLHLLDAFSTGAGVAQDVHGIEVAHSIDHFTAPWYQHQLVPVWLPAMPAVLALLESGADVCDVGCGRGRAAIAIAEAYPSCRVTGIDVYQPALDVAVERAREHRVGDRVRFEHCDAAAGLPGQYDVVTTFDVLHDSADPLGILASIHSALRPEGRHVCLEINCSDRPEENVGPLGTIFHGLSLAYCLPVSMSHGGAGLGTLGLPESRLRSLALDAGFSAVDRAPIDDPFSAIYVLTP